MAFLDKLSSAAAQLGDKANDAIETTKLNSRISTEKKAIEGEYARIGKMYYEKHQNEEMEGDLKVMFDNIKAHYAAIADLERSLEMYKNPTV